MNLGWWKCEVCANYFPPGKILNHIRLYHPDNIAEFDTWPDGSPVVFEDADDFFT